MITLHRTAVAAVSLALVLTLASCGSSGDSDSGSSSGGESAPSDQSANAPTEDGSGEVPSSEGALDLADYREGIGQDDLTDSDELIKATQVLGEVPGYITSDDVLVVQGNDAEALQWLCISKDQLTLDTYTVIVLQADGTRANC